MLALGQQHPDSTILQYVTQKINETVAQMGAAAPPVPSAAAAAATAAGGATTNTAASSAPAAAVHMELSRPAGASVGTALDDFCGAPGCLARSVHAPNEDLSAIPLSAN